MKKAKITKIECSYYKKKHHGNFGVASSMSFSMPKIITMGQGGCVLTDSKQLEEHRAL